MKPNTPATTTSRTRRKCPRPSLREKFSDSALPSVLPASRSCAAGGRSPDCLVVVRRGDHPSEPGELVASAERGGRVPEDSGSDRNRAVDFPLARLVRHVDARGQMGPDLPHFTGAGLCRSWSLRRRSAVSPVPSRQWIAADRNHHPDVHTLLMALRVLVDRTSALFPPESVRTGNGSTRAATAQRFAATKRTGDRSRRLDGEC